jgi:hypothetical protein
MSVPSTFPPAVRQPSRRAVLRWSGVSAFAALTSGFFASPSFAAPSVGPTVQPVPTTAQSGGWDFDAALGLFLQPAVPTGTAVAWEFSTDGDPEGWQPANGVGPFTVSGGTLRTTVTGFDPYIFAPPVRLVGQRDRLLRIRARASGGDRLGIYFATEESPNLAEDKMIPVRLPMDGAFHELTVDLGAANQHWKNGTVTTIRFDVEPAASEGVEFEIDHVRIERLAARLAATAPMISMGSVRPGEEFDLATTVSNVGGEGAEAFAARLSLPDGIVLTSGEAEAEVPTLAPGAEATLTWTARVAEPVPGAATVDLAAPGGAFRFGVVVPAVPDAQLTQRWSPERVQAFRDGAGHVYLQNTGVRLILLAGPRGFVQAQLAVRTDQTWRLLASSQPLTWISVQGADGPELLPVAPDTVRLMAGDPAEIVLAGEVTSSDGTRWRVELEYSLGADDAFVRMSYAATPDRDSDLLAFRGPSVTAGERGFGDTQDMALFPGLEWLVAGERSSGTLDADPPHHLRSTPHPIKVTLPLQALVHDGALVSLQWDTNQAWDGARRHPTPRFASPNWIDGQRNHALTLFVPDVPTFVDENAPWATVAPYVAVAGRSVRVRAELVAEATGDVLRAIDHWYAVHGMPDPAEKPFSWEEELALIRHAYVTSYWVPEVKGWPHVHGWEPEPFVPLAAVLQIAGLLTTDPADREAAFDRVREFVSNVLAVNGPGALGDLDGAHITMFHAPFYLGHLEAALPRWREQMADLLAGQGADGSWRFDPGDEPGRQRLGEKGAEGLGLTAVPAQRLLRYARLTGDGETLDAGLRALAYMAKFDVPRAAQTWEVPVHTPDVLASAYGVGAFAEGYRLTGETEYLRRAEYWARTGLPFLYAWSDPERPMLPYASIPVFGATAFVLPWFGRAVQWNGLVYAYFLLDLLDAGGRAVRFDWRTVAEGLVVSAMHQQRTEEPAKGGYPDVWELRENVPIKNVDINPEGLAKPAFVLMGHPADVQTILLRRAEEVARLSTAATVSDAAWSDEGMSATLRFYEGATSQLMAVGIATPREVRVDGRVLAEVPGLDDDRVAEGWKRLDDGTLLIKLRHANESTVTVRF